jgi:hypothetical protein
MAAINCKQVPLCAEHHKALHNNTLSHDECELFQENIQLLKKEKVLHVKIFCEFCRFFIIYYLT